MLDKGGKEPSQKIGVQISVYREASTSKTLPNITWYLVICTCLSDIVNLNVRVNWSSARCYTKWHIFKEKIRPTLVTMVLSFRYQMSTAQVANFESRQPSFLELGAQICMTARVNSNVIDR